MQVDLAERYFDLCDKGVIRPGDLVHDHDGVSHIVLSTLGLSELRHLEHQLVRTGDGRVIHPSRVSWPIAVTMDEKRVYG